MGDRDNRECACRVKLPALDQLEHFALVDVFILFASLSAEAFVQLPLSLVSDNASLNICQHVESPGFIFSVQIGHTHVYCGASFARTKQK